MKYNRSLDIALRSSVAALAVGVGLAAAPVFAQAQPAPAATDVASPDKSADNGEIVVTGSRIARPDLTSPSPVNVVSQQDISLKAASANIENVLNDLPQVTATSTSASNNPGSGAATVNLRGLGDQRTLVLVDGRRYISYDVTQVVDLNTIPSALIERVDVLTGGASSVYGSDAIAGVVNFVLKHNFSGVQMGSSYDLTQRGDGQIWDTNVTIGANSEDGRGNVTLFGDYTKRKATFAGERGFSTPSYSDNEDGSPLFAGGSSSIPQGSVSVPGLSAALGQNCASNTQVFNTTGSSHCFVTSDAYNYSPVNYLQIPQERFLVGGMARYEINDHFKPYLEGQFINNRVSTQLAATPISNGTPYHDGTIGPIQLQTDSPFFSASEQAALRSLDTDGDGYVTANGFHTRTIGVGPRIDQNERNAFRVLVGMKGDIGYGFSYDGSYEYMRTKNSERQLGNVAIDKFLNAVTTKFDASGNLVCASDEATAAGCVPANIFGQGNLSQAAANYISVGATNLQQYTTQVANLAITNPSLFDLGAGGVGVAFGVEYRSEHGSVTPDTFLASGDVAGFNPGQPTGGGYHVREFFGEVHVPLLQDQIIHHLEVNGAARQTKYSNSPGNVFTWSGGVELSPVKDLTFRGDYQKAIRGPSVNELYLGNTVSFAGNADECGTSAAAAAGGLHDICVAQFTKAGAPVNLIGNSSIQDPTLVNPLTFVGGNPNLKEERAKTYTVGAVFQPSFVPHLVITADYYHIKVSNLIHTISTQTIGNECFLNLNQAFCGLIARDATGEINTFTATNTNTGSLKNTGIDVTASYTYPIDNVLGMGRGKLSFNFSGSRLLHNVINEVTGDPTTTTDCAGKFGVLSCGVPTPKWRNTLRTTMGVGPASLSLQWRYFGKVHDDDPNTTYAVEKIKAQNYFDLTTEFDATDNFTFDVGVSNMFDKKPPLVAAAQNGGNGEQSNTYPTVYDVLGRAFFVSGKIKF